MPMKNRKIDILVKSGVAYSIGVQKGFEIKSAGSLGCVVIVAIAETRCFQNLRAFLLPSFFHPPPL